MKPEARYELVEKIAAGSFATVYRAKDLELGREVAVKQIHQHFLDDPKQLERYWQEAQLLASLQHPNIVTIYDIVRERGWLIMELMQANLAQRQGGRPMELTSLRTTLAHCLRALKFLHEHGVVHGDIKPSNMMIDRRKRVKLGDFGLARRVSNEEGSLLKGTTKYMAPEVVSDDFGEVGPASDLYSLGFAAYDLLCGEQFESLFPGLSAFGRDKQVAWMMWHAAPDRRLPQIERVLEGVPEDLARVIQKLTQKPQAERYKSADEALADLQIDLKVVKVGETPAEGAPPPDSAARKRRLLAIGGFAVSLAMCAALLFMDSEPADPRASAVGKSGIIREIRGEKQELVLKDEDSGVPEVIPVGARPRIFLTNTQQNILLEELQPGDRVRIEKSPGGETGIRYVASRPVTSKGRIKRVDVATRHVVIAVEEGPFRGDMAVRIPESARVELNGESIPLDELKPDYKVDIQHLTDLRQGSQQLAILLEARHLVPMYGFVHSIDLPGLSITVEERQGHSSRLVPLKLAKAAKITIAGRTLTPDELKPDDLQRGDRVTIRRDTEIAEMTAARNQRLGGTLDAISEEEKTFTVVTPKGERRPFVVDEQTEIEIGGELATLEDLRRYDEVQVTFTQPESGDAQAVTLDATRPVKHDRWGIVVGMQNYQDRSIPRGPHSVEDARLVADALRRRYQFPQERLLLLTDVSKSVLEERTQTVLQTALGQTQVIMYFSGQAFRAADGEFYLAPRDFDPHKPEETGIAVTWLGKQLEQCASRDKVLILDTGHGVPAADRQRYPSPAEAVEAMGSSARGSPLLTTAAIAAARKGEVGVESKDKEQGLFAWYLAEGFKGAADRNRDLHISPGELFQHLQERMAEAGSAEGSTQTPVFQEPAARNAARN